MTDMRPSSSLSNSTTNHVNSNNTTSTSNPDLGDINGLTNYVNTIFQQMEEKFSVASEQVMNRMNELGRKIDTLETCLGDIISHLPSEDAATLGTTTTTQQQQMKS